MYQKQKDLTNLGKTKLTTYVMCSEAVCTYVCVRM